MFNIVCKNCKGHYEQHREHGACPFCSITNKAEPEKSDTQKSIDEIAKNNTPLSLQVQEAEAHIAVGLAGVSQIIETIAYQRDHLRQGAKEFIARGKISDFSFEGFEKFLDNAIMIEKKPGRWKVMYPKFIQLDLSDVEDFLDGDSVHIGYHTVVIFSKLPGWLEHLYNKKENDNESNVESDNPTGT